jgi:hypothetical protein
MLKFITSKASERKLRLFASACVRTTWDCLSDERSREVIGVAEKYADGKVNKGKLLAAFAAARAAAEGESATRPEWR